MKQGEEELPEKPRQPQDPPKVDDEGVLLHQQANPDQQEAHKTNHGTTIGEATEIPTQETPKEEMKEACTTKASGK